tara:strand:+ start:83 stop:424 length:342 start_codon:yes stop_codon:yes gene_type:complete
MRLKSELYKKEQNDIVNELIDILSLNDTDTLTLYELDNDEEKQNEIMSLIPKIRKYYSFNNIRGVGEPEKIKRPWLSIIKQLLKKKYKITRKDHRIYGGDKVIRTILYKFEEK